MRHRPPAAPAVIGLVLTLLAACAPASTSPASAGPGSSTLTAAASSAAQTEGPPAPASPAGSAHPTGPAVTLPPPPVPSPGAALTLRVTRALDEALEEERARLRIPGISASIVFADGATWTGVAGHADVTAGTAVTPDTAFSIASISKTFLAALVLELSGEGAFGLEDVVAPLLPELELPRGITVRMLLDHTSGLHDYFLNPAIDRALQSAPSRGWTPERSLGYVLRPYFPPGTGWHYSNTNYLVLGLLAERVAKRPLAEQIRERFLDPLELDGAFYQASERPTARLAHGYRLTGTGARTRAVDLADGSGIAPFRSVVTASGGAGSLAATSRDVARWARALYGGEATSGESLSLMLSGIDRVNDYRPRVPYGLGVQAVLVDGQPSFGHSGRFLGFRAIMRWLPEEGVAIAVLTNQSREDPAAIVLRLLRLALPDPPPVPAPRPH
jgi:D-alanyl-D-alanine carboxypeptidase